MKTIYEESDFDFSVSFQELSTENKLAFCQFAKPIIGFEVVMLPRRRADMWKEERRILDAVESAWEYFQMKNN